MSSKIDFSKRKTTTVDTSEFGSFRLLALRAGEVAGILNMTGTEAGIYMLAQAIVDPDNDNKPLYSPDEIREMNVGLFGLLTTELNKLHQVGPVAVDSILKN